MKLVKKTWMMGASVLLLAACSQTYDIDGVAGMKPSGNQFLQGLHSQYSALAKTERAESDWGDAGFFNDRALMAAQGKSFGPQNLNDRVIPASAQGSLSAARAQLMKVMDAGGAERAPRTAARAQAMFDCWMQEQEENFQPDDIAACRAAFELAMKQFQPAPQVAATPPAPMAPAKKNFTILFDFNKATLNAQGRNQIMAIMLEALNQGSKSITLSGHADRAGNSEYNMKLSERRADAVAKALKGIGVTANINMSGLGESKPYVHTVDGKRQALNRRVNVTLN